MEDYRPSCDRCSAAELAAAVAGALLPARRARRRAAGLPSADRRSPGAVRTTGRALSAAELDGVDAVVTGRGVGIAETGTIVLDAGARPGPAGADLVPDHHVCVVRAGPDRRTTCPDAVARLDPVRPLTWISGPSATSDIELDRVEGVHGPRTLHVLVVEED